ncbi:MAG: hypothetical protein IPM29_27825 [Planctomycetes bacterium]|nr:hypothetical protein [Planctomycetota bacterium]
MRRDLSIRFDGVGTDYDWYVSGQDLLTMVHSAAAGLAGKGNRPATAGTTKGTAWVLSGYESWLGAWQRLLSDKSLLTKDIYFSAGGRTLLKSGKGKSKDSGDGFYMSDVDFAGTDPAQGNIWSRSSGASYREYGRFMHDNKPMAPMEQVAWSRKIASKLRRIVKGEKDYSAKAATDVKSALPVLAVTMFLAEPARNPRAWVVGQMMLDLIGEVYSGDPASTGAKRYLMDLVLAHPDRIDRGKRSKDAPTKPQLGPDKQRYHKVRGARVDDSQGLTAVPDVNSLAKVEGKYPPSPGGSAATSMTIDVANDYIQMKEASIVVRWVATQLEQGLFKDLDSWSATPLKAGLPLTGKSDIKTVAVSATSPTRKGCAQEVLDEVRRLIQARATSMS